jgi:carboxylate-amine ligase
VTAPTFGVEEEFFLADAETGELRGDAEEILEEAHGGGADAIEHELRSAMAETGTAVSPDVTTLRNELLRNRKMLTDLAARRGAVALAIASHPTARAGRVGYGDDERYRRMADTFGRLADESLVCGCHVHVRIPNRGAGVAVIDRIGGWLPTLLALTANSPYWEGDDTGFDSWRARVWSRWPTAGPTTYFGSLDAYEQRADDLVAAGAALDRKMLYYDVRLAENYPTVEIRVADVCRDVEDVVLIAALSRALVMTALGSDQPAPRLPVERLRAANFSAARWGLDGKLLDPATGQVVPARTALDRLQAEVRAALEEAGDAELVADGLGRVLANGNGATRQRAAWRRGGAAAVLDLARL